MTEGQENGQDKAKKSLGAIPASLLSSDNQTKTFLGIAPWQQLARLETKNSADPGKLIQNFSHSVTNIL